MRGRLLPDLPATGRLEGGITAVRDGVVNMFIAGSGRDLVCIDAGWRVTALRRELAVAGVDAGNAKAVFLTHLHWDHAGAVRLFSNAKVFVAAGEAQSGYVRRLRTVMNITCLRDGDEVVSGETRVRAVSTPGHTASSMSYLLNGSSIFTGDLLTLCRGRVRPFAWSVGQDRQAMADSIRKIARLPGLKRICTSHSGITADLKYAFQGVAD